MRGIIICTKNPNTFIMKKLNNFFLMQGFRLLRSFACLLLVTFTYSMGSSQVYVTNGSASSLGGDCFQLTPALNSQGGSVWFQNKLSLSSDFTIQASLNLGSKDNDGADGMAFVLQPLCTGLGGIGGGIGYLGINPSLAVEYDTWQNIDPPEDHIALQSNGDLSHTGANNLAGPVTLANIENGAYHPTVISWDAGTQTLDVTFDGNPIYSYTGDIVTNIFGGVTDVFWGFTAATGSANNDQRVCITNVSFVAQTPYTVTDTSCPNSSDGSIDLNITGGVGPFTFLWSTGATSEDISGLTSGTYTVDVTDANGCVSNYTISVGFTADTEPPTVTCPADIVVNNDPGQCGATVNYNVSFGDNCPGVSLVLDPASGSFFSVGTASVLATATDAAGNQAQCGFNVTVNDTEPPTVTCPADIVVNNDPGLCGATVNYNVSFGDNCPGVSLVLDPASGSFFSVGTASVLATATDAAGNQAQCGFNVTVNDTEPPTADPLPSVDVQCSSDVPDPDISIVTGLSDNCGAVCEVWINELHYDNNGADAGELVEIAGLAGTDLNAYSIVLYNGSTGASYSTIALSGTLSDESNGFGFLSFYIPGLQNGAPDGLALVNSGTVVEFISYEGSFAATNGPASGMTSTDIVVSETSSTTLGHSLQKTGSGSSGADFTWQAPAANSAGNINPGQTIVSGQCGAGVTVSFNGDGDNGGLGSTASPLVITRSYKLQDLAGNMNFVEQIITVIDNMSPTADPLPPVGVQCPSDVPAPDISIVTGLSDNCGSACEVWINELHYDNDGADAGELVEVAGPAGADLSGYSIVAYNGSNGTSYSTTALSGTISDQSNGFGFLSFNISGLQNGAPDGLALVNNGTVVEFISYEGSFAAANGPASGMTSTDIVVSETGSTSVGHSLQKTGSGSSGGDFAWQAPAANSAGVINPGQTMVSGQCGGGVTVSFNGETDNGGLGSVASPLMITRSYKLEDAVGNMNFVEQIITVIDNIPPTADALPPIGVQCPSDVPAPDISIVTGLSDNCGSACEVWINELHYDNDGADAGELVEVAGPAGADLSGYSIVAYNGSNGTSYSTTALSGTISDQSNGFGFLSFNISGLQNGAPDGLALVNNGTVVEFISYEGSFAAANGPASGMTSTDIVVSETGSTSVGHSLQKTGSGSSGGDFAWQAPAANSAGAINPGQTMVPVQCGGGVTVSFNGETDNGGLGSVASPLMITRSYKLEDAVGNMSFVEQIITVIDNILPTANALPPITVECTDQVPDPDISIVMGLSDNCGSVCEIWINEVHYDNASTDVGEFIEIAGPAGTDLSTYSLALYNNTGGAVYNIVSLSGTIDDESNGFGAVDFQFPSNGIQNGPSDGIALVNGTTVIEFISYEGTLSATDGPAVGMTSTSMGVSETSSTPAGESLQKEGTGSSGSDFTWSPPADDSPGDLNSAQTMVPTVCGANISVSFDHDENNGGAGTQADPLIITRYYKLQDEAGNMGFVTQTITAKDDVPPVALCYQDVSVQLDASGSGSITIDQINAGASDACGTPGVVPGLLDFDCSHVTNTPLAADLFISEYIEGSGLIKAVELFNGTGAPINLAAEGYQLVVSFNGGSFVATIDLTGEVAAGDVYVLADDGAIPAVLDQADQILTENLWNGDDAVVLKKGNQILDIFGRVGEDPGSSWSAGGDLVTQNRTLRRKVSILSGVTNNPASGFPTLALEWDGYPQNNFENLGAHSLANGGVTTITATDANGNQSTCSTIVSVIAPPIVIACPDPVTLPVCSDQATVDYEFGLWIGQFGFSSGCNTVGTDLSGYAPPSACGGYVGIDYLAQDDSGQMVECSSYFEVEADLDAPTGSCPTGLFGLATLDDVPEPDIDAVAANFTDNCGDIHVSYNGSYQTEDYCDGFQVMYFYSIEDDCDKAVNCIVVHRGGDTPLTGSCPESVYDLECHQDIPDPNTELIAGLYTGTGVVTAILVDVISSGEACDYFSETHIYEVSDDCESLTCEVTYSGTRVDFSLQGECPDLGQTGLSCIDEVPDPNTDEIAANFSAPCGEITVTLIETIEEGDCGDFSVTYVYGVYNECCKDVICEVTHSGSSEFSGECLPDQTGFSCMDDVPAFDADYVASQFASPVYQNFAFRNRKYDH